MDNYFLRIKGLASLTTKRNLFSKMRYTNKDPHSCLVYFDKSDFEIPADTSFSFLIDPDWADTPFPVNATIKMITQPQGLRLADIPKGMRVICDMKLDDESYKLITSTIPITDSFYEKLDKVYVLSTSTAFTV